MTIMKFIPIVMTNNNLAGLSVIKLPPGYTLRNFQEDDIRQWAEIETAAGEFNTIETAITRFHAEFGPYIEDFKKRSLFLATDDNKIIGTGTAWYNSDFRGKPYGRVHWIAIHPDYQGKKLAKPLVSAVLKLLATHHTQAYLTSQTTSYKAVKMYLDFGFGPFIKTEEDIEGWKVLAEKLKHPTLMKYLTETN